jgi:hypothetical protein
MINLPTLPIEVAQKLTTNWREYYADIYNKAVPAKPIDSNSEMVFRGFRIPLQDLEKIVNLAKKLNSENKDSEPITSVRAYLVKDTPDPKFVKDIHIVLVPVVGGNEMAPKPGRSAQPFGTDLLSPPYVEGEESFIFDFTAPCPSECDTDSILFSNEP